MIRRATHSDVDALAALHVAVWRATYRDVAPPAALSQLDEERRSAGWRAFLDQPEPAAAFVTDGVDGLTGLVAVGQGTQSALSGLGEVKHLYVSSSARGTGLGRLLLQHGARHLVRHGASRVGLAVVVQNSAARAFYARLGGAETVRFSDAGPLWPSDNLCVVWEGDALDALLT